MYLWPTASRQKLSLQTQDEKMSSALQNWSLSLLVVVCVLGISARLVEARESRSTRLSVRSSELSASSSRTELEDHKDSERRDVLLENQESDVTFKDGEGEICKDCVQAPGINIRVSPSRRMGQGRGQGRRRGSGRHGAHNPRPSHDDPASRHSRRQTSHTHQHNEGEAGMGLLAENGETSGRSTTRKSRLGEYRDSTSRNVNQRHQKGKGSNTDDSVARASERLLQKSGDSAVYNTGENESPAELTMPEGHSSLDSPSEQSTSGDSKRKHSNAKQQKHHSKKGHSKKKELHSDDSASTKSTSKPLIKSSSRVQKDDPFSWSSFWGNIWTEKKDNTDKDSEDIQTTTDTQPESTTKASFDVETVVVSTLTPQSGDSELDITDDKKETTGSGLGGGSRSETILHSVGSGIGSGSSDVIIESENTTDSVEEEQHRKIRKQKKKDGHRGRGAKPTTEEPVLPEVDTRDEISKPQTSETTLNENARVTPDIHGPHSQSTPNRGSGTSSSRNLTTSHDHGLQGTRTHGSHRVSHGSQTHGSLMLGSHTQSSHGSSHGLHSPGTLEVKKHSHGPTSPSTRVDKHSRTDVTDSRSQINKNTATDKTNSKSPSRFLSALLPEGRDRDRDDHQRQGADRRTQWTDPRSRYGSSSGIGSRPLTSGRGRDVGDIVRPAAVERLEQAQYPRLTEAADRLVKSMNRVAGVLSNGMQVVHQDYDFVFNGTRYIIMLGVREELQKIAKANDMVYNTVLKATLLTKEIYLRAHRSLLTGPTTRSLSRPKMNLPSLDHVSTNAYDEERLAMTALRQVQEFDRRRKKVETRVRQVREKFQDDFARNDLRTLVYYINSTSQKLNKELMSSTKSLYARRNQAIMHTSQDNIAVARELLLKADDILASGSHDYRGNYRVVQDWKRLQTERSDDSDVGPPVSFRQRPPIADELRELTSDETARIREIIRRLKQHAKEQEQLAIEIETVLRPSIVLASQISSRKDAAATASLASLVTRVEADGKKLYAMLESIRVLIGAQHELRWVRSGSAACREGSGNDVTDDDTGCLSVPEGSGDLTLERKEEQEGSGQLGPPTDDEDFVFVDEKKPPKPKRRPAAGPTSLKEFSQKLSVHVDGVRLRSNDVLQRADQLYEATDELATRWAVIKETADLAERARKGWKEVQVVKRNVTNYVTEISEVARVFTQEVARSYDSIAVRMKRAVEVAQRKLKSAQARKSGSDAEIPETDGPVNDDTAVIEAIEKVKAVRENQRAIADLRAVTPRTCDRVSSRLDSLQLNISHLRQQINKAKNLLQSMELSIFKSGSGYLSIPTASEDPAPSPTTVVEVCIKTTDNDGPVLLVKGNNSATFSLTMNNRQLAVSVFDANAYSLQSVTSDLTLKEDKWYNVKVTRVGTQVSLLVTAKDGAEKSESSVLVPGMAFTQPSPVQAYIGGVPKSEPFNVGTRKWEGCLSGLRVNSRAMSLLRPSSEGEPRKICTGQCPQGEDGSVSFVFDGAGFLHFSADVLPMRVRMQSVHFRFRTTQESAALVHLVNQRQKFLLRVVLTEGAIMIDTTTPTESIILRSITAGYNDGRFHSLKVQYRDSTTYPEIDGADGGFTIERTRPRSLNGMADGVVVGAFISGSHAFEDSQYRPLIGCIAELEIDNNPLSMLDAKMSRNVFVGSCDGKDLWSNCVNFGEDSTGIDLGTLDKSGMVAVVFSPQARGPLLGYARGGKFEAEITLTDEGLTVSSESDNLKLARPADLAEDMSLLTIQDSGKTVTYSVWGQKKETSSYTGFWGVAENVDAPHQLTLAMPLDSSDDRQLEGAVAQLVIGHRYIELRNYTTTNNLSACKRPLPDLVASEVIPAVTSTTQNLDLDSTCRRDIQCRQG